jgi:hypothetical protein
VSDKSNVFDQFDAASAPAAQAAGNPFDQFDDSKPSETDSESGELPSGVTTSGKPWEEAITNAWKKPTDTTLQGIGELGLTSAGNVIPAAGNAAIDLGSRALGLGTDNNHVIPEFGTGEAGRRVLSDVKNSGAGQAVSRAATAADQWVGKHLGATTQDVLHQAGSVAGDVANILPAVPLARAATALPDAAGALVAGEEAPWWEKQSATPDTAPAERAILPGDVPVPNGSPVPGDLLPPALSAEQSVRQPSWEPPNDAPKTPFDEPDDTGPSLERSKAGQDRAQRVLAEIGLQDGYRQSALTGDPLAQSTDHYLSMSDSPGGRVIKAAITNEDDALNKYSADTIKQTGGIVGDDQTSTIKRGNSVTGALQDIANGYDSRRKAIYAEADTRAAGEATDLKGFQSTLDDDSLLTNSDRVLLRPAIKAYMKKLGVVDENGNVTASVKQAEVIRKYLNEHWSPQNSGYVRALKSSMDDDVTQNAGEDIYKAARALNTERAVTLDDPRGISDIMDTDGPAGINRKVASDQVMQKLETMDPPQLKHIVDTLKKADTPKAADALSQIKAHFAQRAHDIGSSTATQWNVKGYNNFLKNNSEALGIVFSDDPERLQRLYTTNEAGKILHRPPNYPGAANSAHNLNATGIVPALVRKGVTGLGVLGGTALTGGPWGGVVGGVFGENAGASVERGIVNAKGVRRAKARLAPQIERASGGRVDHEVLVNRLMDNWHSARKNANLHTENLLNLPDEAITKALQVATSHATI